MQVAKAKGLLRFEQVRQKAYADIQDAILSSMAKVEESGYKNVTVTRFPPYAMRVVGSELEACGYEVRLECQPSINRVAMHIKWE